MKKKPIGHPKRDRDIALDCYRRWNEGQTEEQIGDYYNWKNQIDDFGKTHCITARRYRKEGKKIHEREGKLREEVFGIKYKAPVKVQRKKPIDK